MGFGFWLCQGGAAVASKQGRANAGDPMTGRWLGAIAIGAALWGMNAATAQTPQEAPMILIEDFSMQPETRWRFFTDQVMGGQSTGNVAFGSDAGQGFARMTGRVSTANNGGFIQMRLDLAASPPAGTAGLRLRVRGNGQRYFVHLRTAGTLLPWQYYQAAFDVTSDWTDVTVPLDSFAASGALLRAVPRAGSVTSVAIVAYGRDHDALIDVAQISFYD